jgi:uncharacterized membrane protein
VAAYVIEWLNLLFRWLHVVAGIAWIGSSFYFIWLDNSLRPARGSREAGVAGEVWSVHGGGFYHARRMETAPSPLPEPLHWFKWEAYTTWLTGIVLTALIYWYGAGVYLVDPAVMAMSNGTAVVVAVAFLIGGWVVYDLLCKSRLGSDDRLLGLAIFALVSLLAWGLCQVFGGRGAYLHFGAVLGTIMVANVAMVIIPGQRRMVAALEKGDVVDPDDGKRGKQRSVHNTYFTLPVLFTMTSNHFAMTYSHEYNWLILIAISMAGSLVRAYFVARQSGPSRPSWLGVAALLIAGVVVAVAPRPSPLAASTGTVSLADLRAVMLTRCTNCHAREPSHAGFAAPPAGVVLETDDDLLANASRLHHQTVVLRAMPIGNLTGMTEEERAVVDRWYQALDPIHRDE